MNHLDRVPIIEGPAGDAVAPGTPGFTVSQKTIAQAVECSGVALHSGAETALTLRPAPAGTGIIFRRTDLDGSPEIPARWDHVVDTTLCTTLGTEGGVRISTVEHLMAALAGCHIDNLYVEVDGPEVPIMDGSSQPFVCLVERAGVVEQAEARRVMEILKPVTVEDGDRMVELTPSPSFSVGFEIDFDNRAVARQELVVTLINGSFKSEIARARTFGFAEEVAQMRAAGLARGGSLDNAVVISEDRILNEDGLRYDDEFVRHKVLDAVGDLYLAGAPVRGHFRGVRSGHRLNNELLRALFADDAAWRETTLDPAIAVHGMGFAAA